VNQPRKVLIPAVFVISILVSSPVAQQTGSANDWRARLQAELPLLGHRNWIAIVDSAYPLQTSTGIETVETNGDQLEVERQVLGELNKVRHVRPVFFTDRELAFVPEKDARGVTAYRDTLTKLLEGKGEANALPHEQIISRLDEAGKTFHVLVLKTTMTIPYTSLFIRLDCGYWTDEEEKQLRDAMQGR
jgi:hypothetical protein